MTLQIEILSKAEVEQIWKARARAENFAEYVAFMNARDVGDSFRITVEKGDKNADNARASKHNFSEAAKERVKAARDENGRIVVTDGKITPILTDGQPTPDPVVLRWKVESHLDKRTVKKDGKNVETEVKVIDKLTALVVSTADVKKRGPRKPKAETPPNGATTPTDSASSADVASGSADVPANGTTTEKTPAAASA